MLTEWVKPVAEWSAAALEIAGIGVIVVTAFAATGSALLQVLKRQSWQDVFRIYRLQMSRGILLGLEFLVGADIIHTVALELTFSTVGVLILIVLVRTFLSFTLEVEISGHWPWQKKRNVAQEPRV